MPLATPLAWDAQGGAGLTVPSPLATTRQAHPGGQLAVLLKVSSGPFGQVHVRVFRARAYWSPNHFAFTISELPRLS